MSSLAPKSSKPTPPRTQSSSISSHLAMIELKQKVLTSLSKLSDRDTHQIAVEDLEKTIQTLSNDGVSMLLNCLFDAAADPKPAVKKESLRLLAVVAASHTDSTATHLTKIIAHIVKKLKDPDSGVRDTCRDTIGELSSLYLKGDGENVGIGSVVSLFLKPLFEAMGEQSKGVQSGAAMCMARMVDCASDPPAVAFQKMCSRVCKYLNNPNFLAKSALLPVIASLAQVGAIPTQSLELLLQSLHECLGSTDWATRKAAADALTAVALHSSNLISDRAGPTLAMLEASRFDKIKPVRDSMTEALQLWKKIAGKGVDGDEQKSPFQGGENSERPLSSDKNDQRISNLSDRNTEASAKDSSNGSSPNTNSVSKAKGGSISDKTVGLLKKKAPALSDKELNPEFFQKLETRGSGDCPVEVVVSRRCLNSSSNPHNEEDPEPHDSDPRRRSNDDTYGSMSARFRNVEKGVGGSSRQREVDDFARDKWAEERVNGKDSKSRAFDVDDRVDFSQRESSSTRPGFSKIDSQSDGSFNNKGNWLAIQRQLLQLERQQAHLMNMLQDFMGGSHDGMVTLENRVRGLERVVEDMARDLSLSSGRRGSNFMAGFEGSSNRTLGKYIPFGERFSASDGIGSGMRGRGPSWRSEVADTWDFHTYGGSKNGQMGSSRRGLGGGPIDARSPRSDHESDQTSSRRGWDKGAGPIRFGEGPSARSVWQASKDEATLEAIRVAGEDNGTTRTARAAIPEMTAEAMGDDNAVQDRDPVWNSWSSAMDALHVGDMDTAYAEVLSTGDDLLLVKLMDRSGPVVDQLTNEVASEVMHAIGQFLLEQNLFDICLAWIQQLAEVVIENGPDVLGTPMEVKREILLNLHEASSTMDTPDDWEGASPDQLILQLASAWEIDLQNLDK